jgi:DEAD/DEAH box helicase domain-containing protein
LKNKRLSTISTTSAWRLPFILRTLIIVFFKGHLPLRLFPHQLWRNSSKVGTLDLNKQLTSEFLPSSQNWHLTWHFVRLLIATPPSDDPVQLLVAAGRGYLPVDHAVPVDEGTKSIPQSNERPSIEHVISDMMGSLWYLDQIVHRQKVDARRSQTGWKQCSIFCPGT